MVEGAQGVDAAQAQRQRRHQPVRLLPVQRRELTEVLAGNGLERFRITVQLFLAVCQMHQRHHGKHHPLVAGGEIVQHLAGLLALLLQIVGDNGRKVIVSCSAGAASWSHWSPHPAGGSASPAPPRR